MADASRNLILESIHDDFSYTGTSAVDVASGMLRGRPYGGVALLWRKSIFQNVSVVQCNNTRICGIKILLHDKSIAVMSVYMPTDAVSNLPEFTNYLGTVSAVIDSTDTECVYLLGDFNAHPSSIFFDELRSFCTEQKWCCADIDFLGLSSFVSDAHGSKRWLDNCVLTESAMNTVSNVYIMYDVQWSDHFPIVLECNLKFVRIN